MHSKVPFEEGTLALTIYKFRLYKNMNRVQFAEYCGLTPKTITFIERAYERPNFCTYAILAEKMGLPVEALTCLPIGKPRTKRKRLSKKKKSKYFRIIESFVWKGGDGK